MRAEAGALHLIFNAYWEPLDFELPPPAPTPRGWRRVIDTSLASPDDIAVDIAEADAVDGRPTRSATLGRGLAPRGRPS